jgi:transmembrane sensor
MIGESGNPPFDAQAMSEDQLFEQACAWHFRLQAEDLSAAERAAFAAWLACGQARIDAWDDVQRLLGALREPARAVHHAARARRASPAWGRWACAAVLVLGVALLALQMPWLDRLRADQATAVGESRLIELADGSRIQLNTDSAVQIALGEKERRVHLLRGEAWFEVAKNADRPFFVESGSGWVRVVGTRFSVARQGGRTQVRVGEGRVSVSAGRGEPVYLDPGRAVEYDGAHLGNPHAFDPAVAFAWRQRQLVFRQQSLGEVVAELNRYWPGQTFMVGDRLKARVVSGVFEIDKPEAVLKALRLTLGLRVERYTPYLLLLREGAPDA